MFVSALKTFHIAWLLGTELLSVLTFGSATKSELPMCVIIRYGALKTSGGNLGLIVGLHCGPPPEHETQCLGLLSVPSLYYSSVLTSDSALQTSYSTWWLIETELLRWVDIWDCSENFLPFLGTRRNWTSHSVALSFGRALKAFHPLDEAKKLNESSMSKFGSAQKNVLTHMGTIGTKLLKCVTIRLCIENFPTCSTTPRNRAIPKCVDIWYWNEHFLPNLLTHWSWTTLPLY